MMPRTNDTKRADVPFSTQGYKLLQQAAALANLPITDYIRQVVVRDMQARGIDATEATLSPGAWGGSRRAGSTRSAPQAARPVRRAMGLDTRRLAGLPPGSQAAIFAPAGPRDSYRKAARGTWRDVETWEEGQAVHAFTLANRFPFEVGDELILSGLGGGRSVSTGIEAIRMVTGATLSEADIALLGYASREDWERRGTPARRGWLMVVRVEDTAADEATNQVEGEIVREDGSSETFDASLAQDD